MGHIPTTAHLQASTTDDSMKRQGSGANFVAIAGEVPVCRMNPPMNSSEKPNPYTYQHNQVVSVLVKHTNDMW